MTPRDVRDVRYLVIHHTARPANESVHSIDAFHRDRGFAMIGYNFVVDADGTIRRARPLDVAPAATLGLNPVSINVVLTGCFQPDAPEYTGPPTEEQLRALIALCTNLLRTYPQIERIIGHRDAAAIAGMPEHVTSCPGDLLYEQLDAVRSAVANTLRR
jgi:N-acetylmuramoyl-L-alanine amidase